MKKTLLLLACSLSLGSYFGQSEQATKDKIDQLKKQTADLATEIKALEATLPQPVVPNWTTKGNFSINFGQNLLGNDWSSAFGANSNLNLQGIMHFEANYKKTRHEWFNGFDGRYGFIKNFDDNNTGVNTNIAKNADMLQLSSKYLYDLQKANLKIGVAANFLSQFNKTYDIQTDKLISDILAPGILDLSPGLEWKPFSFLKVFYTPVNGRMTFVLNDTILNRNPSGTENRYGNSVDQAIRTELGQKADIQFEKELVKNLSVRSRAQLFNNYSRPSDQINKINSSRANIDINWQTDLFYKLTKNIAINFGFQTIYDDDIRIPKGTTGTYNDAQFQWRQNFGVGFVAGF